MKAETTRLSSKGQVVIPARLRRALGLRPGEELAVEMAPPGERALVLRRRGAAEVEHLLARGYEWFQEKGTDLVEALHESRHRARTQEHRAPTTTLA
jgi:AbrB family looped-hinge helix DNA binding protein